MRRSEPARPATAAYLDELVALAKSRGITHVGVSSADVLQRARTALHERRDRGLHDGMQFTYRNPERSTDPSRAVPGARSVIVGAMPYVLDAPDGDDGGAGAAPAVPGRVARYAWLEHTDALRTALREIARQLRRDGWKAVAFADDNSMVDREVAHRAGLGWFGKNANLLVSGAGSWFVLGSVVTTAPFEPAAAPAGDGCGTCHRCIDACPTGAIVADGVIDASRCLSWLLQKPGAFDPRYREALGDRIYGCDDCQDSCPPTVHLGQRVRRRVTGPQQRVVDVLQVLAAGDDEVMRIVGEWYVHERDPRWVRRNALIVLGNVVRRLLDAGALDADTRAAAEGALARHLAGDDPILRAHAVWAAQRIGRADLLPLDDGDPLVLAELAPDRLAQHPLAQHPLAPHPSGAA